MNEDESEDDIILDRQDVFAIDDVEVGTDGRTEGGVGTVSYKDLFRFVLEDQLGGALDALTRANLGEK